MTPEETLRKRRRAILRICLRPSRQRDAPPLGGRHASERTLNDRRRIFERAPFSKVLRCLPTRIEFHSALAPMLATLVRKPFHKPGWIYEEKYDGYRILAYKEGDRVTLLSRNGNDRTATYASVARAVQKLRPRTLLLDGEVVAFDKQAYLALPASAGGKRADGVRRLRLPFIAMAVTCGTIPSRRAVLWRNRRLARRMS